MQVGDKRKETLDIPSVDNPADMARAFLEQTLGPVKKQKQ